MIGWEEEARSKLVFKHTPHDYNQLAQQLLCYELLCYELLRYELLR